ncbi:MAG: FMN-binding protein [Agarilytica sp.]
MAKALPPKIVMNMKKIFRILFCACMFFSTWSVAEVLNSPENFIRDTFSDMDEPAKREVFWLNKALKQHIKRDIDYDFHQLRVRYWGAGERTAWVLEEVGKEQPITMGVVINKNAIEDFQILVYRESRGDEVKHLFYRKQFFGGSLMKKGKQLRLSERIDGITGATLSVRATKKVAKVALFLHQRTAYASSKEKE